MLRASTLLLVAVVVGTMMTRMAAAEWEVLYPNVMTVAMGVDATPSGVVYVSGGDDGIGAGVLRTFDGGNTWETCAQASMELMYMDIGMGSDDFGVSGGLGMWNVVAGSAYATDGFTWTSTPGMFIAAAYQSCASINNSTYFLVGIWQEALIGGVLKTGIRASFDGGKTVEEILVPVETAIRYGSFPSENTWYMSCGYWPSSEEKHSFSQRQLNQYTRVTRSGSKGIRFDIDPKAPAAANSYDTYAAEVMKTTDGGKTWTQVFLDYGNFYFNGISCPNENTCVAVAEGNNGAHILLTGDGGATWTQTAFFDGAGLFNVDMLNEKEGWAVGGNFVGVTFSALFVQTIDGGLTWQEAAPIDNAYPNDVVVVNSGLAYATAFLRSGLSSILVYRGK